VMQAQCVPEHIRSPGMDANRTQMGLAVKAAEIAGRVVRTHQPLCLGNRGKRGIDGNAGEFRVAPYAYFNERAEPRPRTTNLP
jgi:hypothetical protein